MNFRRIKSLQSEIKNPILVKKKENLYYLTGRSFDYRAEEYLLVKKNVVIAFGSGLEKIDWAKKADRLKNIGKYLGRAKKLDIEWGFTFGEAEYIKLKVKSKKLKVAPSRSSVDVMRQVKEPEELANVRKSMQIVEKVFRLVRREIKKLGMTEIRLAQFIQSAGLKMGANGLSFPAIVASGANAAIPHHVPSSKRLQSGESIIIDFGFKYKHYCSDFTRTVFLHHAPKILAEAYNQVERAYNESMNFINQPLSLRAPSASEGRGNLSSGIRLLRSDALARNDRQVRAGDVYQKCVDVLAEKKLDKYFIHSLGHGTGLEIHELPNLSPKSKDVLQNGMVFSIEPGVYIPKLGGIRIEDLVYLEGGKVKKFIKVSTKLNENII
jgi:Xaa-Pro aminopeptidase